MAIHCVHDGFGVAVLGMLSLSGLSSHSRGQIRRWSAGDAKRKSGPGLEKLGAFRRRGSHLQLP